MKTSDFDYDLPPELIAQEPLPERTQSRMMVLRRADGSIQHRHIADLPDCLQSGDLLVVNDTKVIPARIFGQRVDTGGRVELLLLEREAHETHEKARKMMEGEAVPSRVPCGTWSALFRASRPAKVGDRLALANGRLRAEILENPGQGTVLVSLEGDAPLEAILREEGFAPVPPYIKRPSEPSPETRRDAKRYQTVYAREPGAVAAPTAGLHFSTELLAKLEEQGVGRTEVTLHVGPGTFKPVKTDTVEAHRMESERYHMSAAAAAAINRTRTAAGRIVAVGTTTVRTLETVAGTHGEIQPGDGRSDLFIYPPYDFRCVDVLLTNFHLPRSTLIMMVSAFAGREFILEAYREAVNERYRFYSYGDCMLIL